MGVDVTIRPAGEFLVAEAGACPNPNCSEGFLDDGEVGSAWCSCVPALRGCEHFTKARIPQTFLMAVSRPEYTLPAARGVKGMAEVHDAVLATLEPNPTCDSARAFATLTGPPGAGKSWLLAHALRVATLDRGISGRYLNLLGFLGEVRRLGKRGAGKLLDALYEVDVLVLDELGRQRGEFGDGAVAELICRRYDGVKRTWLASNQHPNDQVDILGAHTVDRLTGAKVLDLRASSLRQRGGR